MAYSGIQGPANPAVYTNVDHLEAKAKLTASAGLPIDWSRFRNNQWWKLTLAWCPRPAKRCLLEMMMSCATGPRRRGSNRLTLQTEGIYVGAMLPSRTRTA